MKKNKKKSSQNVSASVVVFVFIVFIAFVILTVIYSANYKSGNKRFFNSTNIVLKNNLENILKYQSQQDKIINDAIGKDYSIDNPFIIENPFKINPLSVLVVFNTDEPKSIDVSINDTHVFKTEKSKIHVIPIYGLYSNSKNYIKLEYDGKSKELEYTLSPYNDFIDDINVSNYLNGKSHLFMVGDLNSDKSALRAFDNNNNLVLYMNTGKFTNFNIVDDRIYVEYKTDDTYPGLTLEMDYLGKIYSITSSYKFENTEANLNLKELSYIFKPFNLYPEEIENYKVSNLNNNDSNTYKNTKYISDLEDVLDSAISYNKDYMLDAESNFIFFKFEDKIDELLVVVEDSNYVYSYDISDINMIKHDFEGRKTIFIRINDKYFKLNNIIE